MKPIYTEEEKKESDDWLRQSIREIVHTGTEKDAVPPAEEKEDRIED